MLAKQSVPVYDESEFTDCMFRKYILNSNQYHTTYLSTMSFYLYTRENMQQYMKIEKDKLYSLQNGGAVMT